MNATVHSLDVVVVGSSRTQLILRVQNIHDLEKPAAHYRSSTLSGMILYIVS